MDPFDAAVRELSSPDDYQTLNGGSWLCQHVTAFGWVHGIGTTKAEALEDAKRNGQLLEDKWITESVERGKTNG